MNYRLIGLSMVLAISALSAAAPTKKVTIQPIVAANTDGTNLSPLLNYADYASKIWAQADIVLEFLPTFALNDSTYNTFNNNNAWSLVNAANKGQSSNPLVINAFFVDRIINTSVYGFAYLDAPYMVMDTSNIAGYSALGRVDTFSHELGHVLSLEHYDDTHPVADSKDHLMASGGIRLIPQNLGDVYPDGNKWDKLGQGEIDIARRSKFAQPVPEPATLLVIAGGIAGLCRRRRSAK